MKEISKIKIIAPDIWQKDAVGNFCLDLAELLIGNNITVKLYAQNFSKEETAQVSDMNAFFNEIEDKDIIFLSYSIYDTYLEQILSLSNKKICYFHGVTPAELLEEFEPITAKLCRKSQEQFPLLSQFDVLIANSKFIANDLKKYVNKDRNIKVLPPVFNNRFLFSKKCEDKSIDIDNLKLLYVGRVVPHKKLEDAIEIVNKLKETFRNIKFNIVGDSPNQVYLQTLKDKVKELNLESNIIFHGKVDDEDLYKFYCECDIFITMSEHEGFCIPILEALYFSMPAIVKGGNAAEELVGEFGFVLNNIEIKKSVLDLINFIKYDSKILLQNEEYFLYIKNILSMNENYFLIFDNQKIKDEL